MSNGLAYGVGGGGLDRFNKEVDFKALKQKSVFKKATYTDPFKRLSMSKKGSKSRSKSVDTSPEESNSTNPTTPTSPSSKTKTTEPNTEPKTIPKPTPSIDPNTQISYHSLDASSPTPQLSAILSLSNTIFSSSSTSTETKYSSLSTWQSHLLPPSSIIFFATTPSPSPTADVDPIAFLFAFPRPLSEYSPVPPPPPQPPTQAAPPPAPAPPTPSTPPNPPTAQNTVHEALHIWLTGVLPTYRGHGIFAELMHLVEMHAREKGFREMSVATVPGRFGNMFRILQKGGWVEVERVQGKGRERREGEGEQGGREGKVVFMKNVDQDEER